MTVTQQMSLPLSVGIPESGSLMSPLVELSVSPGPPCPALLLIKTRLWRTRSVTTQYRPGERWGDTIPLSAVAAAAAAVESERRLRESRLN
jgi:hypothetical protein